MRRNAQVLLNFSFRQNIGVSEYYDSFTFSHASILSNDLMHYNNNNDNNK